MRCVHPPCCRQTPLLRFADPPIGCRACFPWCRPLGSECREGRASPPQRLTTLCAVHGDLQGGSPAEPPHRRPDVGELSLWWHINSTHGEGHRRSWMICRCWRPDRHTRSRGATQTGARSLPPRQVSQSAFPTISPWRLEAVPKGTQKAARGWCPAGRVRDQWEGPERAVVNVPGRPRLYSRQQFLPPALGSKTAAPASLLGENSA